jgi:hypothetical protein
MPLYSLSEEKINELEKEVEKCTAELKELQNKDIKQMWLEDIERLDENLL